MILEPLADLRRSEEFPIIRSGAQEVARRADERSISTLLHMGYEETHARDLVVSQRVPDSNRSDDRCPFLLKAGAVENCAAEQEAVGTCREHFISALAGMADEQHGRATHGLDGAGEWWAFWAGVPPRHRSHCSLPPPEVPDDSTRYRRARECLRQLAIGLYLDDCDEPPAMLIRTESSTCIHVSRKLKPDVKAFAIAHELGHALLHHEPNATLRLEPSQIDDKKQEQIRLEEIEANTFAAILCELWDKIAEARPDEGGNNGQAPRRGKLAETDGRSGVIEEPGEISDYSMASP